jgi:WD40 repeat protein
MVSRTEPLAILFDVLSSNAHLFEREPAALAPQVHNLVFNDYGEDGAAGSILGRVRAHLGGRPWLRLESRSASQIRRSQARVLNHGGVVRGVEWARRTGHVVTGSADGVVIVWDAQAGTLGASHQATAAELRALALSPDEECLAIGTDRGLVLLRRPPELPTQSFAPPGEAPVLDVAWAPRGRHLAWVEPGAIKAGTVGDGACDAVRTLAKDPMLQPPLCVRWSPDGTRLAVGCAYGWRLYRTSDWSLIRDACDLRRSSVSTLAWSPSGALALGATEPREGRYDKYRQRGLIDLVTPDGAPHARIDPRGGPVCALAWSPSGRVLASASTNERTHGIYGVGAGIGAVELVTSIRGDGAPIPIENLVTLWDPANGALTGTLRGHRLPVIALQWSADGERLLSASEDGTARIWRAALAEPVDQDALRRGHLDRITTAAICPEGTTFATASDDTTIRLWDLETEQPAMVVEKGDFGIAGLAWSPHSHYDVVVRGVGKRVGVLARFDEGYFRRSLRLRDLTTGALVRLRGSGFRGRCIAWSPRGNLVAAGGARVVVWEVQAKRRVLNRRTPAGVTALAWSPDGSRLAWTDATGRLTFCDRVRRNAIRAVPLDRPAGTALLWLSDERCAVGHEDGAVSVWEVSEPSRRWTSRPVAAAVRCLAFLPDRGIVVAALADASLRLFRATSGAPESPVFLPSPSLALRARGATLDVVDDGSSRGALPGAYRFGLAASASDRSTP